MNPAAEQQSFCTATTSRFWTRDYAWRRNQVGLRGGRYRIGAQEWFIQEPLRDEFLGPRGLRLAEWIQSGKAVVIKTGPHRAVYRVGLSSGTYYVKHYRVHGVRTWLQNNLRPCRAYREAIANGHANEAGIPTAESIGVGRELSGPFSRDSYFITREIDSASPLDEWVQEHQQGDGLLPVRRSALVEQVATLTAALHRNRLYHPDYHAGNILIQVEREEAKLSLIDLHPLVSEQMTATRRWSMFGMLLSSLSPGVSDVDRFRFFTAYQRELQTSDDPKRVAAFVADDVRVRMARADRKWRRGNRRVQILDTKSVFCRGVAEVERVKLCELRDAIANGEAVAESGLQVRRIASAKEGRLGWEIGHALSRRNLPVIAPLLVVASRGEGAVVMADPPPLVPIVDWLNRSSHSCRSERDAVLSELGRCCRRLHQAGFDPVIGAFAVLSSGAVVIHRPECVAQRRMSDRRCRAGIKRIVDAVLSDDRQAIFAAYQGGQGTGSVERSTTIRWGEGNQARAAAMLLVLVAMVVGCRTLDKPPPVAMLPAKHSVRADHLEIISDFRMPRNDPLVTELVELRDQVTATLKLPEPRQDVVVYLFSDEESYRRYLESVHPGLPNRRAYFVGTKNELAVYTFWGDRIQEDLRHEYTHGILHSCLAGVPLWLDEGLAEYFEVPGTSVGGMNGDYPHQLAVAVANGWRPDVNRLEGIDEFSQLKRVDYQEAWAWVHYMLHNSPDTRQTLLGYIAELRDSPHPAPLADRLASVEPSFTSRFLGYVVSLNTTGNAVIRAASADL